MHVTVFHDAKSFFQIHFHLVVQNQWNNGLTPINQTSDVTQNGFKQPIRKSNAFQSQGNPRPIDRSPDWLFFSRNIIHGSDSVDSANKEISLVVHAWGAGVFKSCARDWI